MFYLWDIHSGGDVGSVCELVSGEEFSGGEEQSSCKKKGNTLEAPC